MKQEINIEVSPDKVRTDAEELFNNGGHSCSEAVVSAIRSNIDPTMPAEFVAAATGFSGGVGRSKCICGTISGAVLCLGYFLGKQTPANPTESRKQKTIAAAHELQDSFRQKHKVLCCHVHCKQDGGNNKARCTSFVGEMAEKATEIIARELSLTVVK